MRVHAGSDNHLTIGGRSAGELLSRRGLGGRSDSDGNDGDGPVEPDPLSMEMPCGSMFGGASGGLGRMGGALVDGPGMPSGAAGMNGGMNTNTNMGPGINTNTNMDAVDADGEPMPGDPDSAGARAGTTLGGRDARDAALGALLRGLGLPAPGEVGDLRRALMGSSFFYSPQAGNATFTAAPEWLRHWSAWGESASTRFRGADGQLTLDGEVATATVGVDSRRGRWHAGLAMAYSVGDGLYTHATAAGGGVRSSLASVHPFARFEISERASVWGVLGYGSGELTLTPGGASEAIRTDLSTTMAAFGGRGMFAARSNRPASSSSR